MEENWRKIIVLSALVYGALSFSGLNRGVVEQSDDFIRDGDLAVHRTLNDKVLSEAAYRVRYGPKN